MATVGQTVRFTAGGVTYQGTVLSTPTSLASGLANNLGGEPFYEISCTIGNQTTQLVRASELF